jgi:protein-S-isoprenylcysteine O-methyltransferase Ste14
MTNKNQKLKIFAGLIIVPVLMGTASFLSAGTFNYWQAWLFLSVYVAVTHTITLYFMKRDPALITRRMQFGEKRLTQRIIMLCITVFFISIFVISGLDHKFAWSPPSMAIAFIGEVMIILSFYIYFLVFRENSFASSTIQIAEGQKVISTGPYSVVRHPMYFGGIFFLAGIPLALGSLWALLILIPLIPFLIWRLTDEEQLLRNNLKGYNEYCSTVKYRLIPGIY